MFEDNKVVGKGFENKRVIQKEDEEKTEPFEIKGNMRLLKF